MPPSNLWQGIPFPALKPFQRLLPQMGPPDAVGTLIMTATLSPLARVALGRGLIPRIPTGLSCATMTIFESDATGKSYVDYWCDANTWTMSSIFRQTVAATTTDDPRTTAATPGSTTVPATSATNTSADSDNSSSSSGNQS
ncbi:hypothetical protein PHISCL_00867 [Aspergillus sclerotialis]|uniref:Uncharacterized protein n=1 Tax=Aspergillus sclerotialis TaxID=2070753 RepID=A0A3A2ZUM0_9EURO|nr:hypothetical protein PHISCL_00867 [Aspergillus sclerotialis]